MKKIFFLLAAAIFLLCSCEKKNLPDVGKTAAEKMANEWWVTLDQGGVQDASGYGHFKIATYNTSANDDSIWIDDFQNAWEVKFKAKADYNNLTFASSNAANEYYAITVNVTDGKILPNAGHSKSGNVVDSIHMQIEFSDDPGTIYEMNGVARTRFAEDDY
jgi:hypothetical protein